jgi:hypothetical protein
VFSAHKIAILPSAPAARRVSAAVALANPPPTSRKSTTGASFKGTYFGSFKSCESSMISAKHNARRAGEAA